MTLHILNTLPNNLLNTPADQLYTLLPGPTLIHLEGENKQPLFISVLLHGNETTGWQAMQQFLKKYQTVPLPRSVSLFIGNVAAAQYGRRRLEGQLDYNRVWPDEGGHFKSEEHLMAQQVYEIMAEIQPFISIDMHNNSGQNPHYACINRLDNTTMQLAKYFSDTVVYFTHPRGAQSLSFTNICPAITIECGKVGNEYGASHAMEYVDTCLCLEALPQNAPSDINLFQSIATVKMVSGITFSFDQTNADVIFRPELDLYNFVELEPHTVWASSADPNCLPVEAISYQGEELTLQFFVVENGQLKTAKALMPSMIAVDKEIVTKDCLCYLMQRLEVPNNE